MKELGPSIITLFTVYAKDPTNDDPNYSINSYYIVYLA